MGKKTNKFARAQLLCQGIGIWLIYRLLVLTWRVRVVEHDTVTQARSGDHPCVFAHWHGDELVVAQLAGRYRIATMTSQSADGQLMDFVLRRLGGTSVSGSSSRGARAALKGLVRLCRQGWNASVAVDGPRGPLHKVKPGVFQIARLADAVIVPVGQAASNRYVFENAWNKAKLPWPFARVVVYFGPTQSSPASSADMQDATLGDDLGESIHAASRYAVEILHQ